MKRTMQGTIKHTVIQPAWPAAEYAALQVIAADTCDDRASESIFEHEDDDERAEVDNILYRLPRETS